jgi:hypothetical protein
MPRWASLFAAARPMPLVPPVMRAVNASVAICGFSLRALWKSRVGTSNHTRKFTTFGNIREFGSCLTVSRRKVLVRCMLLASRPILFRMCISVLDNFIKLGEC